MGSIGSEIGSQTDYAFTVYRGTFIQSVLPDSGSKPELSRNQGALWVSAADGRIHGRDWKAGDDSGFAELMSRSGWVDINAIGAQDQVNGYVSKTRVKIVTANEEQNEFFFPGFIGMHWIQLPKVQALILTTYQPRHPHPCPAIPQRRPLRLINSSRLARDLHIPRRVTLWVPTGP